MSSMRLAFQAAIDSRTDNKLPGVYGVVHRLLRKREVNRRHRGKPKQQGRLTNAN